MAPRKIPRVPSLMMIPSGLLCRDPKCPSFSSGEKKGHLGSHHNITEEIIIRSNTGREILKKKGAKCSKPAVHMLVLIVLST